MTSFLKNLTTQRLMVIILFLLLFGMVGAPIDTDTWWHLRSGDYILANRRVPLTDPFSFTKRDQPWIDQSWGSQVIMVGFYRVFGGTGLAGDTGNIGLAVYMLLLAVGGIVLVYRMCEGNVYTKAAIIILAAATASIFWSARPQMMSFFLSAVVLYLLYLYRHKQVDRLWLIPILMVIWVNLHSGFAIGFILLLGTIAGEVLGKLFGLTAPSGPLPASSEGKLPSSLLWRQIGKLALITILSAVLLVINPNTTQMWTYPFKTVGIGALQQFIQEWASPNFHIRGTWPFLFMLLAMFAVLGLSTRRIDCTDLVLVCGTAFMALYAGRNIATFAIVAAPVLSRHLNIVLEDHGWRLMKARPVRGIALILNVTILLGVLLGVGLKIALTLHPKAVAEAQANALPVRAAAYLNAAKPAGPMFNSYNWGGYLMFAAPEYPVFVDGRTDLYDDALLNQWLRTMLGDDWHQTFEQWHIRLAVIEKDSALAKLLRHESSWKEVYTDQQASIFQLQASTP